MRYSSFIAFLVVAGAGVAAGPADLFREPSPPGLAAAPKPIPPGQFDRLLRLIKPGPDELRFRQISWLLSVHDARVQAAAQGKPILIWSGSGGAPLGVC